MIELVRRLFRSATPTRRPRSALLRFEALEARETPAVVAQWTFNSPVPDGDSSTGTLLPSTGRGSVALVGGTTHSFNLGDIDNGSSDPNVGDDTGLNVVGFPAQGKGDRTAGIAFSVDTTGYKDIKFSFDQRNSNTASGTKVVQYSTDNGASWRDAYTYFTNAGERWTNGLSVDLSGVPEAANNPALGMRILSAFDGAGYVASQPGSNYTTRGTWRFDMVTASGVDQLDAAARNWNWKLDETGRVLAVSGADATLNGLANNGYDAAKLAALGQASGVNDPAAKLAAGVVIDLSGFLPETVRSVLTRQQTMSYEDVRQMVELTPGGPKGIPAGKTVGTSGIDWLQGFNENDDGVITSNTYISGLFGYANCYGFVGLMLGMKPPEQGTPQDFAVAGLKSEGVAGATEDTPMVYRSFPNFPNDPLYTKAWTVIPEGGLVKAFTGGKAVTTTPNFGAVALFRNSQGVSHAAIVLGRTSTGEVVVLQKLNASQVCAVTTVGHPRLQNYGTPTYYQ